MKSADWRQCDLVSWNLIPRVNECINTSCAAVIGQQVDAELGPMPVTLLRRHLPEACPAAMRDLTMEPTQPVPLPPASTSEKNSITTKPRLAALGSAQSWYLCEIERSRL
jgi:hypothetical protein